MGKICLLIPAYNVESTIHDVISSADQYINIRDIVVINDGSIDSTGSIAKSTGATVISNPINRGKGFSLKAGFQHAIKNEYDAVLCLDGDLQHDPHDIPKFLNYCKNNAAELILGNRMGNLSTMPWDRQFSNQTTSLIISILTGQRVRDSQTGYRLIKTHLLKKIKLASNKYETESELLVKILKNNYKIAHVPIKTIYNDQPSHINRFVDTLRFIRIVILSLIKRD